MRTLRLIVSFDADYYPELTGEQICETLAKSMGKDVSAAYRAIPCYLNTKIEVINDVMVDDVTVDSKD
jgi:hypothetical protein